MQICSFTGCPMSTLEQRLHPYPLLPHSFKVSPPITSQSSFIQSPVNSQLFFSILNFSCSSYWVVSVSCGPDQNISPAGHGDGAARGSSSCGVVMSWGGDALLPNCCRILGVLVFLGCHNEIPQSRCFKY